jgi:hypothetical protein
MPAYYTYLISSLPELNFSAKPPFGLKEFFARCRELIPEKEYAILETACGQDGYLIHRGVESLNRWINFEIALRNELARARAARKKIDPLKFLRLPDEPEASISHLALSAYRNLSVLEAEKMLDQARWEFLEELRFGHYFDLEQLLIYGLKLKLLVRWDKIQSADKEQLLNAAIAG